MSEVTAVPLRPIARGSVLKLWLALIVLLAAAGALAWWGTAGLQSITTASGLRYQVLKEGEGPTVTPADLAAIHYTGRLPNGTVFDTSESRGQPMVTGVTGIIPGLGEALQLMRAGGEYRLWIPPHLGYGSNVPQGAPFGPTDTLQFDIRVMEIAPGMAEAQRQQQMQQLQQMMQQQGGEGAPPGAGPEGGVPGGGALPPGAAPPGGDDPSRGRGRGGR